MNRRYGTAFLALVLALGAAGALYAQGQGRVFGQVVDENGKPVQGVKITISSDETGYHSQKKTDKRGKFTIIFLDATIPYHFVFEKDGYQTYEENVKAKPGSVVEKQFVLPTVGAAPSAPPPSAEGGAPSDPVAEAFNEGVMAYRGGDLVTAEAKFKRALELKPDLAEAYSALAGVLMDQKKYNEALAAADKLLELDPNNVRALEIRYDSYQALGDEEKAKEALAALTATDTGGADAAVRIYNEGAEAARVGDTARATERFQKAIELDPNLAAAHYALSRMYLSAKRFADAAAEAEKALALDPKQTAAQKVRYEAYRALGDQDKAKEAFQQLAAADPKGVAKSLLDQGIDQFNNGKIPEAQSSLEQALQADPSLAKAHYMLGLCFANEGDNAQAKEHLLKFIEMAPNDPDVATAKDMVKYFK